LDVDGAWRDHLLVAQTVDELEGSAVSRLIHRGLADWA
jgi:ribosomal-protein-alanine N-acetyltransferase